MTVSDFFDLEPVKIIKLLKAHREYTDVITERDHVLNFVAFKNAIGLCLSSSYKYVDVFKKEEDIIEYNEEEYGELKDELLDF